MPGLRNPAFVLVLAIVASGALAQDAMHAPDGRAPKRIRALYFGPRKNAPFMAVAKTEWVQIMPDNSTITTWNQRVVARDMDGRVFQERRTFVPNDGKQESRIFAVEYDDPLEHKSFTCNPNGKICFLNSYFPEMAEALLPTGLQPDGASYLTRENLGVDTYEGLEVERSRETFTYYKQTIGNTKTILRTVDFWYSPALGINVKVVRHDPRDGDQTLWLTDLSLSAPAPATFEIPGDYRVFDRRLTSQTHKATDDAPRQ
jgi:hypothetical protein